MNQNFRPRNGFEKNLAESILSLFGFVEDNPIDYTDFFGDTRMICRFVLNGVHFALHYGTEGYFDRTTKNKISVSIEDATRQQYSTVYLKRQNVFCEKCPLSESVSEKICELEVKKLNGRFSPYSKRRQLQLQARGNARYRLVGQFVYLPGGRHDYTDTALLKQGEQVVLLTKEGDNVTNKKCIETVQTVVSMIESIPAPPPGDDEDDD